MLKRPFSRRLGALGRRALPLGLYLLIVVTPPDPVSLQCRFGRTCSIDPSLGDWGGGRLRGPGSQGPLLGSQPPGCCDPTRPGVSAVSVRTDITLNGTFVPEMGVVNSTEFLLLEAESCRDVSVSGGSRGGSRMEEGEDWTRPLTPSVLFSNLANLSRGRVHSLLHNKSSTDEQSRNGLDPHENPKHPRLVRPTIQYLT